MSADDLVIIDDGGSGDWSARAQDLLSHLQEAGWTMSSTWQGEEWSPPLGGCPTDPEDGGHEDPCVCWAVEDLLDGEVEAVLYPGDDLPEEAERVSCRGDLGVWLWSGREGGRPCPGCSAGQDWSHLQSPEDMCADCASHWETL